MLLIFFQVVRDLDIIILSVLLENIHLRTNLFTRNSHKLIHISDGKYGQDHGSHTRRIFYFCNIFPLPIIQFCARRYFVSLLPLSPLKFFRPSTLFFGSLGLMCLMFNGRLQQFQQVILLTHLVSWVGVAVGERSRRAVLGVEAGGAPAPHQSAFACAPCNRHKYI